MRVFLKKSLYVAVFAATSQLASAAITLSATADLNTAKSAPDSVITDGASLTLKVANSSQPNSRTGYIKFDTTGVTSAEHGTTATLTLATSTTIDTNFTITVFALNAGTANYNWTEGNLTWNNSPAFINSGNYVDATKATATGSPVPLTNGGAAGTTFSVNLNNWQNFVQADNTITFIVVVTSQVSGSPTLGLHSSESLTPSLAPALSIVPEPATVTLTALGAFGLLRRRR